MGQIGKVPVDLFFSIERMNMHQVYRVILFIGLIHLITNRTILVIKVTLSVRLVMKDNRTQYNSLPSRVTLGSNEYPSSEFADNCKVIRHSQHWLAATYRRTQWQTVMVYSLSSVSLLCSNIFLSLDWTAALFGGATLSESCKVVY